MPQRLLPWFDFTPMSHRPPLPAQWWWWCAVAYLAPSFVLRLVPAGDVPYRDLIWLLTMPIYSAYGAIAISVGWLSQQLHEFYAKAIEGERIEVVSQVATAMRHEVNNALATILAECQLLEQAARITHPEDQQSLQHVIEMARRIRDCMDRLVTLTHAPTVEYAPGVKMIDLAKLKAGA